MLTEKIRLDPVGFFCRLDGERHVCFLKNTDPTGWKTLIAFNPADILSCTAGDEQRFAAFVQKNSSRGRKLIGYISYDTGYALHGITTTARDDLLLPDIYFCAFDNYICFDGGTASIHCKGGDFLKTVNEISKRSRRPVPEAASTNFARERTRKWYSRAFKKIKRSIYDGDIYQINLTHRFRAQTTLPARELFRRVIAANPVDFLAYIEGHDFEVLSASPERFIKINNRSIETCPIKGTRPRGRTPERDEHYRQELLRSRKEAAELNMITDLLRNDLGRVCEIGSVRVAGSRLLSRCPTVWHTYSKITGTIARQHTPVDALLAMLPGGSVTGCPKKRAMEIIDELEPTTRSVYTGVIGYIDPGLDLDFSIAIRTVIKKENTLYLQVGGGIVDGSREEAEFRETLEKARSFMHIL